MDKLIHLIQPSFPRENFIFPFIEWPDYQPSIGVIEAGIRLSFIYPERIEIKGLTYSNGN